MLLAIEIKTFIPNIFLILLYQSSLFSTSEALSHDTYLLASSEDVFPLIFFSFLFFKEGRGKEGGNIDVREKHWFPPVCAPTREWTHNLDMCPDWELNARNNAPTGPCSQGCALMFKLIWRNCYFGSISGFNVIFGFREDMIGLWHIQILLITMFSCEF